MDAALLSPVQAAERLSVSQRTLERWRVTGEGPAFVRIGSRKVGYSPTACDTWTASRTFPHRAAELARSNPETQQPAS
jgi:predicted DNA-binding transcriptional regulator AlpA